MTRASLSSLLLPLPAQAFAQLAPPDTSALERFDLPRDKLNDMRFALGMSEGMKDYEAEASPKKASLFRDLLSSLPPNQSSEPLIVEVGMGSFPNSKFYHPSANRPLDIVGVDPNDSMKNFAMSNAEKDSLMKNGNSVRIVHGVSEALPFNDGSVDAVVCSLTLCSVLDPQKSISEIKRVLKPGGKFLFWEHVLSQTDSGMANFQIAMTPAQVRCADGCHLNRKTGETINNAGFKRVDMEYFELKNFGFLNPTVAGIATK
ncbi:hypothetical protein TrST_g7442 [Triparma strigata]|uniref:Methyltransferase type 11 domain-containing protein n=1 Tax=Triparma strigata TaxID=1606541 RepID=A0A9W7DVK5_9STRA|nr:hypothetical protein TrST_g7442 [Triparma strigata]